MMKMQSEERLKNMYWRRVNNGIIWPTIWKKRRNKTTSSGSYRRACGKPWESKLVSWASITKGFTKWWSKDFGNGSLLCRIKRANGCRISAIIARVDSIHWRSSFRRACKSGNSYRGRGLFSTRASYLSWGSNRTCSCSWRTDYRSRNVTRRESWRRASEFFIRSCPRSLWWGCFCKEWNRGWDFKSFQRTRGSNWRSNYWKFRGRNRRVWRRHSSRRNN